ncbi:MAG TPA: iron-sulfur cluster co-chaperone HscB C-terminal domain-containing protein [Phycisphaerales bacterium]|nr:iron-sulfur cluster co-chaperone HscB C-terminal domain-containing protein [Phycisphaerales bacterium]
MTHDAETSTQIDPFALLNLPRTFDLIPAQIQSAYLRLASATHPDLVRDPFANAEAARNSAALNHARQMLLNPESRANALHQLLGGPTKEQNNALPAGFLMDIMEAREQLESAQSTRDPAALRQSESWANAERERYISLVREALADIQVNSSSPDRAGKLAGLRVQLNAWRYIERMIQQLDPDVDSLAL